MSENIDEKELKKMYLNYINNLINYFKITDVNGFRKDVAIHLKHQPNINDEDSVKKWGIKFSKLIEFYTTLSKEEIDRRMINEFQMVKEMADRLEVKSEENLNA